MSEAAEARPIATPSQTVGPFFHFGLAPNRALGTVARPGTPGAHIRLRVQVLDGHGAPLADALVETYQANAEGVYGGADFSGFGRLPTEPDGTCVFSTIRPGAVPDGRGGVQAPHINVCLFARGLLRHVYTRIYFAGDPGLDRDPLLTLVPEGRRTTLLARACGVAEEEFPLWVFTVRLQGDQETVFFDL